MEVRKTIDGPPKEETMAIANKLFYAFIAANTFVGLACSNKCFLTKSGNEPSPQGSVKKANPNPATWPPSPETPTPSKTISPTGIPKVESASGLDISPSGNSSIQPTGGFIPPPVAVSDVNPNGVVQAQRLETVPAGKRPLSQTLPQSNQDSLSNDSPLTPFPGNPGNSLIVPPPPPGSPLNSSAPLGIPTPPSGSPNR